MLTTTIVVFIKILQKGFVLFFEKLDLETDPGNFLENSDDLNRVRSDLAYLF